MAQGYRCDWPDHDAPADVTVMMLAAGDVSAYCMTHYLDTMRGAIALLDQSEAEAAATDAAAIATLEGAPTPLSVGRARRTPRHEPTGEGISSEEAPEQTIDAGAVEGVAATND